MGAFPFVIEALADSGRGVGTDRGTDRFGTFDACSERRRVALLGTLSASRASSSSSGTCCSGRPNGAVASDAVDMTGDTDPGRGTRGRLLPKLQCDLRTSFELVRSKWPLSSSMLAAEFSVAHADGRMWVAACAGSRAAIVSSGSDTALRLCDAESQLTLFIPPFSSTGRTSHASLNECRVVSPATHSQAINRKPRLRN